ncbi:MAG: hypothetical protein IIX01_04690 [Clostridia bacterium]|nr:hypothetical protein [Clostridia bacterium]
MKKRFLSCIISGIMLFGASYGVAKNGKAFSVEVLANAENGKVSDYGDDIYSGYVPPSIPEGFQKERGEVMFWEEGDVVQDDTVVYNGNNRIYNYAPSILQINETTRYAYYCTNKPSSLSTNLNEDGRHWVSDYVACRKGVLRNGEWYWSEKKIVVSPVDGSLTEGSHICDPNVVKGEFSYNGKTYPYLMGYLACSSRNNTYNHICFAVAKSPMGPWIRCEEINPFIEYNTDDMPEGIVNGTEKDKNGNAYYHWGYGQISMINTDKKGNILMFYSAIRPFSSGANNSYWQGALTEIRRVNLSNLNAPVEEFFNPFLVPTGIIKDGKQVDTVTNGDYAYDEKTGRIYALTDGGLFFYVEDRQEKENPQIGDIFRDYQERNQWGGQGEPIWKTGARLYPADQTNYKTAHNVAIIRDAYGFTLDSDNIEAAISSGVSEGEFDQRFPDVAKTGDDKIGSYRILHKNISIAPQQLDEKAVRKNLRESGFRTDSDPDFSGVRLTVPQGFGSAADNYWWGYGSLYLGLTNEDAIDLSKADNLQIELRNNSTTGATWIRFHFIDADGDVAKINYNAKAGTFTPFGRDTVAADTHSDYRGFFIGGTAIVSGVASGKRESDFVYYQKGVSSADGNFDWSKVTLCELRIHCYDAKSFDVGSLYATVGGEKVTLFDGEKAKEVASANAFGNNAVSVTNLALNKNEWYFGAQPTQLSSAHTSESLQSETGMTAETKTVQGANITMPNTVKTAEITLLKTANGQNVDWTGTDGLSFKVDTTAFSSPVQATFHVSVNGVKYTANGTSGAVFVAQDYTAQTPAQAGVSHSGYLPKNFKGEVIVPFTAFTNGTDTISSDSELSAITKVSLTLEATAENLGKTLGVSNLRATGQTQEKIAVYSIAKSFVDGFTVAEGVYIRLSDPAGLMFGASVHKIKYNGMTAVITNAKYEYGTVIVPDEERYENAMPYDENILTIKQRDSGAWNGNYFEYYAAIVQIHPSNYQRKFKAKAYFCVFVGGEQLVLFAQESGKSYSVYETAKTAVASGCSDEYLTKIISTVESN